eukprot:6382109-Prymnesium_polylepis.1
MPDLSATCRAMYAASFDVCDTLPTTTVSTALRGGAHPGASGTAQKQAGKRAAGPRTSPGRCRRRAPPWWRAPRDRSR